MLQDPRILQILCLSVFLLIGVSTRDWTIQPEIILVAIASALLAQQIATFLFTPQTPVAYPSALITGLSLSLLFRTEHPSTMAIAATLAIFSKFLLRSQGKHFFNPANFGIMSTLILTQDAWVSPGQWGEDWAYLLLFIGCGGIVLKKVGRWDTTIAFLGTYFLLEALRILWLGESWDIYFHRFSSGSFFLFALFMITDPRSIPNARISRIIWAISIAGLTFILRNYGLMSTAVFWALFLLSPLTIILDYLWRFPQFSWLSPEKSATRNQQQPVTSA